MAQASNTGTAKATTSGKDAQTANEEQGSIGLVGALEGVTAGPDGVDGFSPADSLDNAWGESSDHTAVETRSGVYAQDRLGPRNSAPSRITGYASR